MLPFDRRPWAKRVAVMVITLSFAGAVALAFYFYDNDSLHISEVVGILLLLLTILPPNLAILVRKPGAAEALDAHSGLGHSSSSAHSSTR